MLVYWILCCRPILILPLIWLIKKLRLACYNFTCTKLSHRHLNSSLNCGSRLRSSDLRDLLWYLRGCRNRGCRNSRDRCGRLNRSWCSSLSWSSRCTRIRLLNCTRCRYLWYNLKHWLDRLLDSTVTSWLTRLIIRYLHIRLKILLNLGWVPHYVYSGIWRSHWRLCCIRRTITRLIIWNICLIISWIIPTSLKQLLFQVELWP